MHSLNWKPGQQSLGICLYYQICCLAEGIDTFRLGAKGCCHWRERKPVSKFVLCGKNFSWMHIWELNPEEWGHFGWRPLRRGGGGIILAEDLQEWGNRAMSQFSIIPWHLPYSWGETQRNHYKGKSVNAVYWNTTIYSEITWNQLIHCGQNADVMIVKTGVTDNYD
jgi:hypothetical protein